MKLFELVFLGIGLAMDAFSVSLCKGLAMKKIKWKNAIIIALYFGIFQGVMPIIGYFLGTTFMDFVDKIDHWIAFVLLSIIGLNMIRESKENKSNLANDSVDFKTMVFYAIATSIDALAVGVTFAFFKVNVILAGTVIGIITLVLSLIGVLIGTKFGNKFQNKAQIAGGIILIVLGLKILLEHLEILTIF